MRSHINQPGQECWAFSESIWWCEESSSQPTGQIWSRWSNSRGIVKYLEYIAWCCTSFNQPTTPLPSPQKVSNFQRTRERCHYKISAVFILQLGIFVISATVRCVSRWQEAEFDLEVVELFDAGRNQSEEGWRRGAGGDS